MSENCVENSSPASQPHGQSQSSQPLVSSGGSSGGGGPLCSMETVDVADTQFDLDEEALNGNSQPVEEPWGRLFGLGTHFKTIDLCNREYSFGRGDDCDYSFNVPEIKSHPCFLAYSKVHFKLSREDTTRGCHTYLEDCSSNGTFVNGTKVGKNNRQVLNNNDSIGLAAKKNKAFVFMDLDVKEDMQFPEEVRNKYTISQELGRGACGEVKLVFEKGTCRKFAIKVISKKTFSFGGKTQINLSSAVMNEANLLKALKHPSIIEIEDVIDTPETLYIVLELVEGGELFDRVVQSKQLDEQTAKLLFYQLVDAIKYLHTKGITHRDLKPENVLLATDDKETLIKVTDFGLSKFVDGNSLMKTFCGTPSYLAPEILLTEGTGSYTQAIDCWSLGVILFICLGGYPPFSEDYKDLSLRQQILKGRYSFPKDVWGTVSKVAIDLIRKLLTVDPKKRLTSAEALDHPWLKDDEMLAKAHKLMYPGLENDVNYLLANRKKPKLKRQREQSDETLDGDGDGEASNGSVENGDCHTKKCKSSETS